ncbi:serine protease [Haloferula sp. A504]|uniref:serine protease n=1 Tax=Haloferula sp. A504 TaxID=3373601 RepID=UPI0031BD957F|nr:serine protease [Verrucomicrobiaceae bacterium E54]
MPVLVVGLLVAVALLKPDDATETASTEAPVTDPFAPSTPSTPAPPSPEPIPVRPPDGDVRIATTTAEAERAVLMLNSGDSRSTAFLGRSAGRTYIYTAAHSITSTDFSLLSFRGDELPVHSNPEVVTGEAGHDLIRFPFRDSAQTFLEFASREKIEEKPEVFALGDSGAEDILSTLPGRIQGVGPHKIEVDCEFIPGNSGGPIVTKEAKVVGVVSYATSNSSIWAKNTQHEVRRFAWIPADNLEWVPVELDKLAREPATIEGLWESHLVLIAISHVTPDDDGLSWSDDVTIDGRMLLDQVFAEAEDHPMVKGLFETNGSVLTALSSGESELEGVRSFLRFFRFCADLAEDQFSEADKTLVSSFHRKKLADLRPLYEESVADFRELAGAFDKHHELGRSLSSFK